MMHPNRARQMALGVWWALWATVWLLLWSGAALAADLPKAEAAKRAAPSPLPALPDAPAPVEPGELDCPRAWDIEAGRPVPDGLIDVRSDGSIVARCNATALPKWQSTHALLWVDHAEELRAWHPTFRAEADAKIAHYYRMANRPWYDDPAWREFVGAAKMLIAVGVGVAVVRGADATAPGG